MGNLLKGKDVATFINQDSQERVKRLLEKKITVTLALVRVGNNESDLSYERGTLKRCEEIGVKVKSVVLAEDISKEAFYETLDDLNNDNNISGILVFRPLPERLDNEKAREYIKPEKDVDGCTSGSLAGVFTNSKIGFAPCTAEAAVAILDYYNIEVSGKNVVVIGRSLVIGKPVSMLLLNKNATVTICHSKTNNIQELTKKADIVIVAIGKMESINKDYFSSNQTVIDVGINYNPDKAKLCGDVAFEEVEPIVSNITPVPGGVGSVTTSILVRHVIEAAERGIK